MKFHNYVWLSFFIVQRDKTAVFRLGAQRMQDVTEVRLLFVFGAHPVHGEVLRKAFTGKGNELCIIDVVVRIEVVRPCLLYTSDAADEL